MFELLLVIIILPLLFGIVIGVSNEKTRYELYHNRREDAPKYQTPPPAQSPTDEERYRNVRREQLARNHMTAISQFIYEHSLGVDWSWAGPGGHRITVKDEDGVKTNYMVYYKAGCDPEESKVFAFREVRKRSETEDGLKKVAPLLRCSPGRPLTANKDYLVYRLNRGKNQEAAERLKALAHAEQKAKDPNGYYAEVLQSNAEKLQGIAYQISSSGEPVVIAGSDYNEGMQPTKRELRALAEELEAIGFIVKPINFRTKELTLNLAA